MLLELLQLLLVLPRSPVRRLDELAAIQSVLFGFPEQWLRSVCCRAVLALVCCTLLQVLQKVAAP